MVYLKNGRFCQSSKSYQLPWKYCSKRNNLKNAAMWVANSFVLNWNIATTTYFNCGFSVPVRALLLLGARGQTMLTSNWGFEWRKNDVPPTSSHRSTFVYRLSWYTTNCRDQLPAQTRTFPRSSSIVHHKFWLNRKATARSCFRWPPVRY